MNRNRAHWSAMGLEERTEGEERPFSEKELRRRLSELVAIWGIDTVITAIRKIYEDNE